MTTPGANGNGNGLLVKIVGTIVALGLSGAWLALNAKIDDVHSEMRAVAATQQARGERLGALETIAKNNAARIDRIEQVADKQVTTNSQKLDSLEERLRRIERGPTR